jgi:hypothetical protein
MQLLSRLLFIGIFYLYISCPLFAQETAALGENKTKQEEVTQKALEALQLLTVEARTLKLPENRASLLSNAFALLWPYQEKAARELIPEITENLKLMFSKADENTNQNRFFYGRRSTREQAINVVARVDLEMALELARVTRPTLIGESTNKEFQQAEIYLEQNLANQIATYNPDAALKLAEQSLEKGISHSLRYLINTILKKSPHKATPLFDKIYKQLQSEDILINDQASGFVALFLEDEYRAHKKDLPKGHALQGITLRDPSLSKEELKKWTDFFIRQYLTMVQRADVLKEKGNQLQWLLRVTPFLDVTSPELIQSVNAMLSKLRPKLQEHERESLDANRLMVEGKVDELIAMAEKLPKERKDEFLWNAIHAATDYLGDPDLANKVIENHVASEEKKKQYRDFVAWFNSFLLADQGKIEEVIASLSHLTSNTEKARTIARIAESNVKSKSSKIQLLERALQYLSEGIDTSDPFSAYCYIAGIYAQIDIDRSLALFEPQIDPMNQFWEAAAVYCSFESNGICRARKNELIVSIQGGYIRSLYEFLNAFRALSKADFSRTYEVAQRIKSPEIRSNVRLVLIESVLTAPEKQ